VVSEVICHVCGIEEGTYHTCPGPKPLYHSAPVPHCCPVCSGSGKVSRPPWVAGDQESWTDTGTGTMSLAGVRAALAGHIRPPHARPR
jgi:hypothetical protein